jgi:hypothetical protein
MYFDVLSGTSVDDFAEEKYHFYLNTPTVIDERNKNAFEEAKALKKEINERGNIEEDETEEASQKEYYERVDKIVYMSAREKEEFKKMLSEKLCLNENERICLNINIGTLEDMLTKDNNVLKTSTLDENRPADSKERKSESDILEAFVRVNQEGVPLSRSDLIFSMLKLNWKRSAKALPEFIHEINNGNSFELDIDFVIRCLFAVSELGTKFDIDKMRKPANVEKLKNNFDKCCAAIESTIDFIQRYCWSSNSKVLGGYYNFIPLIYYLFHIPQHQVPNNQISNIRKTLYLFGFTRPFSRYADSRLWTFIREELIPSLEEGDYSFPYKSAIWWVKYWEKIQGFDENFFNRNPRLVHHLVENLSGSRVKSKKNSPELDHIFPKEQLKLKGFNEHEINHFANFWLLGKYKNQQKYVDHPKNYFDGIPTKYLKDLYIKKDFLDYRRYRTFLNYRSEKIVDHIKEKVHFKDSDFTLEQ